MLQVVLDPGGSKLHPIDIVFWMCFLLGAGYTVVVLLMGGLGHLAGHLDASAGHIGHVGGDVGHVGHIDTGVGHVGHIDTGAGHIGHAGADAAHVGHVDAGHAPSNHAELVHSLHGPHAPHVSPDAGSDETSHQVVLLSYLNPLAVAGFLLGFGGLGVAARASGTAPGVSTGMGIVAGYLLWLAAYLLVTRVFAASEGTSHYRQEDLIGIRGVTTTPVTDHAPGMITCAISGSRQSIRAMAEPGEEIPVGAAVRVRKIEKGTATVTRIE